MATLESPRGQLEARIARSPPVRFFCPLLDSPKATRCPNLTYGAIAAYSGGSTGFRGHLGYKAGHGCHCCELLTGRAMVKAKAVNSTNTAFDRLL
jgi:hypothetical protein